MRLIEEFKNFAIKGNMIDMAIGIIIGAAFKDVINILVNKIFMLPLSLMTEGVNFMNRKIILREAYTNAKGEEVAEVALGYGEVINVFIDFFIIALVIFVVIKVMNSLKDKADDPKDNTVQTPKDIQLLDDLKELMKEQNDLLKGLKQKN